MKLRIFSSFSFPARRKMGHCEKGEFGLLFFESNPTTSLPFYFTSHFDEYIPIFSLYRNLNQYIDREIQDCQEAIIIVL